MIFRSFKNTGPGYRIININLKWHIWLKLQTFIKYSSREMHQCSVLKGYGVHGYEMVAPIFGLLPVTWTGISTQLQTNTLHLVFCLVYLSSSSAATFLWATLECFPFWKGFCSSSSSRALLMRWNYRWVQSCVCTSLQIHWKNKNHSANSLYWLMQEHFGVIVTETRSSEKAGET